MPRQPLPLPPLISPLRLHQTQMIPNGQNAITTPYNQKSIPNPPFIAQNPPQSGPQRCPRRESAHDRGKGTGPTQRRADIRHGQCAGCGQGRHAEADGHAAETQLHPVLRESYSRDSRADEEEAVYEVGFAAVSFDEDGGGDVSHHFHEGEAGDDYAVLRAG
mmetsp:Transcript_14816/g.31194  ORF Transcript_14816/g.31194 Transcript_14816/m.31194 type:complete len:162 (+) Transcript_14816:907-1392(+)